MGGKVDVPALVAKECEIGEGGLGSGDDHQIGVAWNGPARRQEQQIDVGLGAKGVEFIEVGDSGQHQDHDPHPAAFG
jgi:hypothetical protein